jgi:hypothetical protein
VISLSHAAAGSAVHRGVWFRGAGQSVPRAAQQSSPLIPDTEADEDSLRITVNSATDSDTDEDDIETGNARLDEEEEPEDAKGPSWTKILKVLALGFLALSGGAVATLSMAKPPVNLRPYNGMLPIETIPISEPPPLSRVPVVNSTALALMPRPVPLPISHPDALPYPVPALNSQWPNSVELLASSSQNHYSYFSEHGSDYTNSLADSIGRNGTNSLGQSHADMREHGYRIRSGWQYPVSSADVATGWCINAWDKRDTHKQRFALLLDGGREFRRDCRKWKNVLRHEYQVPRKNILYYPDTVSDDVADGIRKIRQQIQDNDLTPKDVEIMVYYSGHGRAFHPDDSLRPLRDGEASGIIALADGRYWENTLRDTLKAELPEIPTTVILDACQSGSWIA